MIEKGRREKVRGRESEREQDRNGESERDRGKRDTMDPILNNSIQISSHRETHLN